jgi:flagellar M-ring protein FliF
MAGFGNFSDQARQFWASRTGGQKMLLLGGAAITVAMVAVFARFLGTPEYKPLYKDMEPADAQALVQQLDAENIPNQLSADGKTVSVPADKLDAARMQTAEQGQPHSGRLGFEIFDKVSWGQTEFDEKVAYQRAMEGELERTIQTLADVESARVHLVMPDDSVFLDRQRSAKASVIVKLRRDGLSKDAVMAISRLVAGAVDGLKPEDVAIIDADSDRSLGLSHDNTDSSEGDEARLDQQLMNTLEPVVGANAIRASVNIQYDRGSSEENAEKYDPTVSALLSQQSTEDTAGGNPIPAGVPGTASNVPVTKAPKSTPTATQSSKSESSQYGVNKTVIHTVTPAGRIQRLTAAILVDDAVVKTVRNGKTTYTRRKRSQDELNKIQALAEAAIGYDAKRGDTISVQDMPFDGNTLNSDVPAAGWATKVQKTVSDYSSLVRPVSLLGLFLLVYLFLVRPIQKQALAPNKLATGMQPALAAGAAPALPGEVTENIDVNRKAAQLKDQAFELVRQKPADTARAMQAWVREG